MYQIAVCDDEAEVARYLGKKLVSGFAENGNVVTVDYFEAGERFLQMFESHYHYDVVFLDIDMPGMDGIEVCRRIRRISTDCICVFISNKEDLVFQTFEVQPFRFVRKTEFHSQCRSLVKALLLELQKRERHLIQIVETGSKDILSFEISGIFYIEAQRKKCRIATVGNEVLVEVKFMWLESQLLPYYFLKPHRSFLVNCQHIFRIKKESIIMKNGISIPVSRNRINEIRDGFLRYASGEFS